MIANFGETPAVQLAVVAVAGLLLVPALAKLFRLFAVEVEDNQAVLITRFGKLVATLTKPGLHVVPDKVFPWVKARPVSLRRDFRDFNGLHVNDQSGTTVLVDLWVEFRVVDPAKAAFRVLDWEQSLRNLVAHAATSILGNLSFQQILRDRTEIGELLRREIATESERWGIEVDFAFLRNVNLLPEVSRQVFESIAARLERAKAGIEEFGRVKVAKLMADVDVEVATLVATAKGQYPAAIGRALSHLATEPEVCAAYNELYSLSLIRPHRTIAFRGFDGEPLRAIDAAMLLPNQPATLRDGT